MPLVQVNNLGLALVMALKFYNSVAKGLKLKGRKVWGLIFTLVEVSGKKLVRRSFWPPPPFWIGLKPNQQLKSFEDLFPENLSNTAAKMK